MNDDRLRQLIGHPPRDPERAPDPAFTAAVMARVAPAPAMARPQRRALAWCAGTVVVLVALVLPADPFTGLDGVATWFDRELMIELGCAVAVAAVALALSVGARRIPA